MRAEHRPLGPPASRRPTLPATMAADTYLTGSALLLGLVGFAGQIPSFLLAPIAGVLIDRWNRHRLREEVRPMYVQLGILPEVEG